MSKNMQNQDNATTTSIVACNTSQNSSVFGEYLTAKNIVIFLMTSILGVALFMVPVKIDGSWTVLIKKIADIIGLSIKEQLPLICCIILGISAVGTSVCSFLPKLFNRFQLIKEAFVVSKIKLILRIVAFATILLVYFQMTANKDGYLNFINLVIDGNTGGFVLNDLLTILVIIFVLASFFLPLLTDFGLLEFVGCLLTGVMRPLFKIPGRAAIDCLTSWIGDGSVGILLTCNQYEKGYYSSREAIIVATTFSSVSITFSIVVLSQVGLMDYVPQYYLSILLIGFVCAVIMPRIPPLSMKKDTYLVQASPIQLDENMPSRKHWFLKALDFACIRTSTNSSVLKLLKSGLKNSLVMWLDVLPSVMFVGTLALFLANHTPIFDYLSVPFVPLYEFFNVPEAEAASKTVLVGFVDMFVPSIIASGTIASDMTKFIIAVVSVTQLIYLSEVGGIILGSKLKIGLWGLLVIYLERTLISMVIICPIAHLIFN